jgi:hypothetical protein
MAPHQERPERKFGLVAHLASTIPTTVRASLHSELIMPSDHIHLVRQGVAQIAASQNGAKFWATWELNNPTCDEGLVLLSKFAEAHPGAYQRTLQHGFVNLILPLYGGLPRWEAFVQHCSTCEECNKD